MINTIAQPSPENAPDHKLKFNQAVPTDMERAGSAAYDHVLGVVKKALVDNTYRRVFNAEELRLLGFDQPAPASPVPSAMQAQPIQEDVLYQQQQQPDLDQVRRNIQSLRPDQRADNGYVWQHPRMEQSTDQPVAAPAPAHMVAPVLDPTDRALQDLGYSLGANEGEYNVAV
jgi:hypothetical protein